MDNERRSERDEQDAYGLLDASEQKAIRFLLDCAASRPGFEPVRHREWLAEDQNDLWQLAQKLVAFDCLGIVPRSAAKLADAKSRTDAGLNATVFFGEAVSIGVFCIRNGFIRTFDGFDFLFTRIFGGLVRPLTPSLFAASLLHPDVVVDAKGAEELATAMWVQRSGWGTHEPVWFPNHPLPPLTPIGASGGERR